MDWGSPSSYYVPSEEAFQFTKAWAYCWRGCWGIRWWFIIWVVFFSASSVLDTWRAACTSILATCIQIYINCYVELKFKNRRSRATILMFQTIGGSDPEPLAVVIGSFHEHIIVKNNLHQNNAFNLQISFLWCKFYLPLWKMEFQYVLDCWTVFVMH